MLKTFCSQSNPTWCILPHGLKMIWGNFQTAVNDSYFWKKWNDWLSSKTITTNLNRNHMAYPNLFYAVSTQSAYHVLYQFFFHLCATSWFSSQVTVNSVMRTLFFKLVHATMSGCFSVWMMWTGNCRDVLRSTETF